MLPTGVVVALKVLVAVVLGLISPAHYSLCPKWLVLAIRISWFAVAVLFVLSALPPLERLSGAELSSIEAVFVAAAGLTFTLMAFPRWITQNFKRRS